MLTSVSACLTANRLAIVDGSTSWTMLKVDQVDSDGARLIPLNRQRSLVNWMEKK